MGVMAKVRAKRGQKGFTLVELAIVIVIMSLLRMVAGGLIRRGSLANRRAA